MSFILQYSNCCIQYFWRHSSRPSYRFTAVAPLLTGLLLPLWAQEQQPPDTTQGSANRAAASPTVPAPAVPAPTVPAQNNGTSRDRIFFTLPNFLTLENAANVPPQTAGQKFKALSKSAFDPAQFVWFGLLAGISQARDTQPSFGQGAEGYAKRYGTQFGDGTIEDFCTRAIFPSILRQDPRYYQLGKGSFFHRTGYALSRFLITRSDAKTTQFNFSSVFGSGTAAAISTYTYHPRPERNFSNVLTVWGTQAGWDSLANVLREFWPDIRHRIRPAKAASAGTAGAPGGSGK
jgi:hypothetical protein